MAEPVRESEAKACIAYHRNSSVCANGFVQTHFCWFGPVKCSQCGEISRSLPNCLREEIPVHFVTDNGSPRFYRQSPASPEGSAS